MSDQSRLKQLEANIIRWQTKLDELTTQEPDIPEGYILTKVRQPRGGFKGCTYTHLTYEPSGVPTDEPEIPSNQVWKHTIFDETAGMIQKATVVYGLRSKKEQTIFENKRAGWAECVESAKAELEAARNGDS
jgi:hypothetical protein